MLCDTKIHLVCLLRSYRRLRVIFQEEIRPLLQTQLFPFPYYIQCITISGLKPFPQQPLSLLPVLRECGFPASRSASVAIANPPERRLLSSIHNTIIFSRSRHSLTCPPFLVQS